MPQSRGAATREEPAMPCPVHFEIPIPTVGWLAYAKDTEGNLFGLTQFDSNAK